MDKAKSKKYLGYGIFFGLVILLFSFLTRTPGGKKVASQIQEVFPGFQIPGAGGLSSPNISIGVPAGGGGPSLMPVPIPSGGCNCKVSLCDGSDNLQVKSAPNWSAAYLSDAFGVSFGDNGGVGFNYGGMTPTQVYGVFF